MTANDSTVAVLRYFDCRNRGQALRFAMAGSSHTFQDVRLPIVELDTFRKNAHIAGVGGPFAALPVLEIGGHSLAQTLAIATFLDREMLDGSTRPSDYQAWLDMILNAAHLDMQAPYSNIMWLPEDCDDDVLVSQARALFRLLVRRLTQLESLHAEASLPGKFFGGLNPAMADYFVYESLSRACLVFKEEFEGRLCSSPRLEKLRSAIESDRALGQSLIEIPKQITASPSEFVIRERVLADRRLWN